MITFSIENLTNTMKYYYQSRPDLDFNNTLEILESVINADRADPSIKKEKYTFMNNIREININNKDTLEKFINQQSKEDQNSFNELVRIADLALKSRVIEKLKENPKDASTLLLFKNIFQNEIKEKIIEIQTKETEKMFNIANSMNNIFQ